MLRRVAGKAHTTSFVEGTDDAVVDSLITVGVTTADVYNDANTLIVNVGGSALTTANIATGASVTGVNIGTGMGSGDTINVGGTGSQTVVGGDLVVNGTTTTVHSEVVNIRDNHLYLNADYTTAVAQTGGLVVNYLPTATADTEAAGGFTSTTTVATTGAAVFAAGDFIQVSGAANQANDGIYEVLTHAANVLTIDSTPVHSFSQTAFTVDATGSTAAFTQVTVSAIQAGTDGIWETGAGSTAAGLTFTDLATGGGNSLQAAYVTGNAITMTDAEGDFDISVTSGTPAISLDAAGASNFTVAGAGLTLSTTTSGTVLIDSAGLLDMNAAASMDIDVTGTYDMLSTGAFSIDGTGASNVTATSGSMTVSTLTTGDVILDSVDSVSIDGAEAAADAVSIQASNAAGGIDVDAGTAGIAVDTTGGLSLDSAADSNLTAANTTASTNITQTITVDNTGATAGDATLDINATSTNGSGVIDMDADDTITIDTLASGTISVGADAVDGSLNFGTGAAVKTVTVGSLTTTSATTVQSGATGDITLDARGMTTPITLNQTGDLDLDGGFTATSIIGALNELLSATSAGAGQVVVDSITTGLTVGAPVYLTTTADTYAHCDADAAGTSDWVGFVKTVGGLGTGEVVMAGKTDAAFEVGLTITVGDALFLSTVTGRVTNVAPSGVGDTVYELGYCNEVQAGGSTTDGEALEVVIAHSARSVL